MRLMRTIFGLKKEEVTGLVEKFQRDRLRGADGRIVFI
jgi:hypothetical protein